MEPSPAIALHGDLDFPLPVLFPAVETGDPKVLLVLWSRSIAAACLLADLFCFTRSRSCVRPCSVREWNERVEMDVGVVVRWQVMVLLNGLCDVDVCEP